MANQLDQATLHSLLHYDPESGVFTWLRRPGNTRILNSWNTRCAGKQAGHLHRQGYVRIVITIDGVDKSYKAHRLAWLYVYGGLVPVEVDHINRIKSDNRIVNLRPATRVQNRHNRTAYKNNTSGMPGVTWHKRISKWHASISLCGKRKSLGYFDDIEEAKIAYKNASLLYLKEFSIFSKASA